jgi:hypothetical protein
MTEIYRVNLTKDVLALCRDFEGGVHDSSDNLDIVRDELDSKEIDYSDDESISIFYRSNPDKSAHGLIIKKEIKPPKKYFIFKPEKVRYLQKLFKGDPLEEVPKAMIAMQRFAEQNFLEISDRVFVYAGEEKGQEYFELYAELV